MKMKKILVAPKCLLEVHIGTPKIAIIFPFTVPTQVDAVCLITLRKKEAVICFKLKLSIGLYSRSLYNRV